MKRSLWALACLVVVTASSAHAGTMETLQNLAGNSESQGMTYDGGKSHGVSGAASGEWMTSRLAASASLSGSDRTSKPALTLNEQISEVRQLEKDARKAERRRIWQGVGLIAIGAVLVAASAGLVLLLGYGLCAIGGYRIGYNM